MSKIHELSRSRARQVRMTSRFAVGAIIAAAVVIVGIASFTSLGDLSTVALGDASATTRATPLSGTKLSAPAGQPDASAGASRFDYFPDHYLNQAKEPAEPLATF